MAVKFASNFLGKNIKMICTNKNTEKILFTNKLELAKEYFRHVKGLVVNKIKSLKDREK